MRKFIRLLNGAVAFAVAVIFAFVIYGNAAYPDVFYVQNSSDHVIDNIYYLTDDSERSVDYQSAQSVGDDNSNLTLLGIIPVKSETIKTVEENTVLVSGHSFGIKLYTDGVMVVGTKDITVNGKTVNPSEEAGVSVGDIIVSINGEKVYSSDRVSEILNDNNGKAFRIRINRNGEYRDLSLEPIYVDSEGAYKAGMWVRDSTAGIGTITFFNPSNSSVAALGHPITDVDTGEIMPILDGQAVETTVTSVTRSTSSETGSICCDFSNKEIGELSKNTTHGIYGSYTDETDLSKCCEYEVALPQEVQKGFCQIITTVDENGPKVYSAEITKINQNDDEKNMVIKITDEELIKITGGIVQGMSGSPIIQNGKLIGAITHVIVNNPLKGYAVFAQTMLEISEGE
ncbi:MAG TPA: SpoIVB peptidase [Candidatus Eubacterium faecavium]|nr:SpoIVB peptidase [Candidatus Eubacterium faecavium]